MFNKRGIAPLVATLLLISFATSLGVVIMNFGRAQVELQAECAIDINLKLAEIGGKPDVCLDATSNNLRFTAENGVNINVEGLIVNIIGTQKAETNDLPDGKIPKAGTYIGNVPWNKAEGGDIRQVKITPKVILFEEEEICTEKALIFETVNPC